MIHILMNITGIDNVDSKWYAFWSGIGSDLGELALLGLVYRYMTCHESRCRKLGLHHVEGTPFRTCKSHHPQLDGTHDITVDHIRLAWHRATHK